MSLSFVDSLIDAKNIFGKNSPVCKYNIKLLLHIERNSSECAIFGRPLDNDKNVKSFTKEFYLVHLPVYKHTTSLNNLIT